MVDDERDADLKRMLREAPDWEEETQGSGKTL